MPNALPPCTGLVTATLPVTEFKAKSMQSAASGTLFLADTRAATTEPRSVLAKSNASGFS